MTETNIVPIILSTGGTLLAAIIAAAGVLAAMLRGMNVSMNRRFDDAQRTTDKRFDNAERTTNERFNEAQRTTNERFNEAQRANDQAHAGITENILRVERQQDAGLNRLYGLLSAIVPRAAAEVPPGDKA